MCSSDLLAAQPGGAEAIRQGLCRWNLPETPIRPRIETLWQAIAQRDDWQPLHRWLAGVMQDASAASWPPLQVSRP